MIVAAVAYDQLSPSTKARVAELLALNGYPTNGRNNASARDQAKATFMMAATSSDAIKKDMTHFTEDGEDPTDTTKAPKAMRRRSPHIVRLLPVRDWRSCSIPN